MRPVRPSSLLTLLLASTFVSGTPVPQYGDEGYLPCSKIESSIKPGVGPRGTVPAKLAFDCLNSIPLNVSAAIELVDSIRPYFTFQSTIGFLKNPPAEYKRYAFGPVDLMGGLDKIKWKVMHDQYHGEYEVGLIYDEFSEGANRRSSVWNFTL